MRRGAKQLAGIGIACLATVMAMVLSPGYASSVANGNDVEHGRYEFAVALTMKGITRPDGTKYDSACSAALIAPRWIATAGHCFHDGAHHPVSGPPRYERTVATVGRNTLHGKGGHDTEVIWVQQAPNPDYDFAIAKLAEPIHDVRPLAISRAKPKAGQAIRMTGWGAATADVDGPEDRLERLQTGRWSITQVTKTTVLAQGTSPERTTSACPYDSGAPYFAKRDGGTLRLVAVESDGPACPHGQEETLARVDPLLGWITRTILAQGEENVTQQAAGSA